MITQTRKFFCVGDIVSRFFPSIKVTLRGKVSKVAGASVYVKWDDGPFPDIQSPVNLRLEKPASRPLLIIPQWGSSNAFDVAYATYSKWLTGEQLRTHIDKILQIRN